MGNLIEEIQSEISRCKELIKLYEEIPTGGFGAAMIKQSVEAAVKSLANAYSPGLLSYFGIYCYFNQILWTGSGSKENCIERVKYKQIPEPKPDKKVVCEVKI